MLGWKPDSRPATAQPADPAPTPRRQETPPDAEGLWVLVREWLDHAPGVVSVFHFRVVGGAIAAPDAAFSLNLSAALPADLRKDFPTVVDDVVAEALKPAPVPGEVLTKAEPLLKALLPTVKAGELDLGMTTLQFLGGSSSRPGALGTVGTNELVQPADGLKALAPLVGATTSWAHRATQERVESLVAEPSSMVIEIVVHLVHPQRGVRKPQIEPFELRERLSRFPVVEDGADDLQQVTPILQASL